MNPHKEMERARLADEIMKNELFNECFNDIRANITEKWRSAPIRDAEGQQYLKIMDKVLTDIELFFTQIIQTGKMADIQLENERKLAKPRKSSIM